MSKIDFAAFRKKADDRRALAARLASDGRGVRLFRDDGRYALASVDTAKPDTFRLTSFDERGPIGHMEFPTLVEAIDEGLKGGYAGKEAR